MLPNIPRAALTALFCASVAACHSRSSVQAPPAAEPAPPVAAFAAQPEASAPTQAQAQALDETPITPVETAGASASD